LNSVHNDTPGHSPVSDAPCNSNHRPTGSKTWQAPTDSSSKFLLEPHIPTSSISPENASSFGLPIPHFTKKFLKEAG
jgi:hypothetical protein